MKPLSRQDKRHGHLTTKLTDRDGLPRAARVHQLVALAFIGPRPEGMSGHRCNGTRADNRVENLRYDTASANVADSIRNGKNYRSQVTHCPRGHAYDEANTYVCKRGKRMCRTCSADRMRARRAAAKAAV